MNYKDEGKSAIFTDEKKIDLDDPDRANYY